MKNLYMLLKTLISIYILAGILLFVFQRDFLYFPTAKTTHPFPIKQFSMSEETIDVIVLNNGKDNAIIYFVCHTVNSVKYHIIKIKYHMQTQKVAVA